LLPKSLGVTFQQVQKYEYASNRISAGRLFEMGGILGVPISYFFDGLQIAGQSTERKAKGARGANRGRAERSAIGQTSR
jgi:transcriptional regulator with XRE-family HTH domain